MYGSGFFFGKECKAMIFFIHQRILIIFPVVDQVTISPDLIVPNQSIGVAFFSDTFQGTGIYDICRFALELTLSQMASLE